VDYKEKKILVIGLARSGRSAIKLLVEKGAEVIVVDMKKKEQLEGLDDIEMLDINIITGGYSDDLINGIDFVVKSPGVEMTDVIVREAIKRCIPVIDELELAYQNLKANKLIAITGTNGKSTVVSLIGHILKATGISSYTAGNIGDPLSAHASEKAEYAVIEISTFQLEAIDKFRPNIGVLLNITEDHLTRHMTMDNYTDLKFRLFENQRKDDIAMLNKDDRVVWGGRKRVKSKVIPFTQGVLEGPGAWVEGNNITVNIGDGSVGIIEIGKLPLRGPHNLDNYLATTLACYFAGANAEAIAKGIMTFKGLPHRMEFLGNIGGVDFYNDSKATNPASLEMALRSFNGGVVLIAGGRDKGTDFSYLREIISERVKAIVLIGEAREKMAKAFDGVTKIISCDDLDEAVRLAYHEAHGEGIVLLSPGCTSFDMFTDFEDRGDKFRRAVEGLKRNLL